MAGSHREKGTFWKRFDGGEAMPEKTSDKRYHAMEAAAAAVAAALASCNEQQQPSGRQGKQRGVAIGGGSKMTRNSKSRTGKRSGRGKKTF